MKRLKQTLLVAAVLGMFVLGTAGIVLSEDAPADEGAADGAMSNMSTTEPAPLDGMSIPAE